jgi:hypothetical protein
VVEAVRLDMAGVRDNTFRTVCFESVRLGEVIDRAAELRIRGVDGELGRSVTLWLSGHAGAPRVLVDGEISARTLVYDLRVDAGNRREQVAAPFEARDGVLAHAKRHGQILLCLLRGRPETRERCRLHGAPVRRTGDSSRLP